MSVVLACDLGGTNFRAALIDTSGQTLAESRVPSPSGAEGAGWAEIDPDDWWAALVAAVTQLAESDRALLAQTQAIAICGVTRTQVFLDAQGRSLRPAMTWRDARAAALLPDLLTTLPAGHPESAQVNAFHPVARLAWLRRHEPQHYAQLRTVLEPKDYLNFRLTGVRATDVISSARLLAAASSHPPEGENGLPAAETATRDEQPDIERLRPAALTQSDALADASGHHVGTTLLEVMGLATSLAPQTVSPTDFVGPVIAGLPDVLAMLVGVPVYACSNDTWAAVAGLGALRPGYAYNISGTTEVFGVMGSESVQAPGLMTVQWGDALYQVGGPGQNGADTLAWLLSLLRDAAVGETSGDHGNGNRGSDSNNSGDNGNSGGSDSDGSVGNGENHDSGSDDAGQRHGLARNKPLTFETLLAGKRDTQPVLFLPYLQGERVPHWDANLRGAFVGLNRRHRAIDLAWAVMEGVAFLNRIVLERGEQAIGTVVSEIRYGGGATANPLWCQAKADICERPVVIGQSAQPGLLGAAMVAWTGLGRFASLSAAQAQMAQPGRRYEPRAAHREAYRQLAAWYAQASEVLTPVSHGLAAMDGGIAR